MKLKIAAVFAAMVFAAGLAQAETKTFPKPKIGQFRVDFCLFRGAQCGLPAADKFCQRIGYIKSSDFDIASSVGATSPTISMATSQICNDPGCDGFAQITCEGPDGLGQRPPPAVLPNRPPPPGPPPGGSQTRTYFKPRINGARLNYCETRGSGCGQDAADAFCDLKGYDQADDYVQSPPAPPGAVTRYIGDGTRCKGSSCYAFNSVTCSNN